MLRYPLKKMRLPALDCGVQWTPCCKWKMRLLIGCMEADLHLLESSGKVSVRDQNNSPLRCTAHLQATMSSPYLTLLSYPPAVQVQRESARLAFTQLGDCHDWGIGLKARSLRNCFSEPRRG